MKNESSRRGAYVGARTRFWDLTPAKENQMHYDMETVAIWGWIGIHMKKAYVGLGVAVLGLGACGFLGFGVARRGGEEVMFRVRVNDAKKRTVAFIGPVWEVVCSFVGGLSCGLS